MTSRLQKNIGYAMVPDEHSKDRTSLTIATPNGNRPATMVREPFVDTAKEIPKS